MASSGNKKTVSHQLSTCDIIFYMLVIDIKMFSTLQTNQGDLNATRSAQYEAPVQRSWGSQSAAAHSSYLNDGASSLPPTSDSPMLNRWFAEDSRLGPYNNISKVYAPQLVFGVSQTNGQSGLHFVFCLGEYKDVC